MFKLLNGKITKPFYIKNVFTFIHRKNIYYDHVEVDRNIDFMCNLGMNEIPQVVKPNISVFKLSQILLKRKLIHLMKHYYKTLLESIESGELQIFDEILEKKLKYALLLDLEKFTKLGYHFTIENKNSPIFIKILSVYEMSNISIDRELNGEIDENSLIYHKNKIHLNKNYDGSVKNIITNKDYFIEKENFSKSNYVKKTLESAKNDLLLEFNISFIKNKLGSNFNERNVEYMSGVIDTLNQNGKDEDLYTTELKKQFKEYYIMRDEFVNSKIKSIDLFDYFMNKQPLQYKALQESTLANKGLFARGLKNFKNYFYNKFGSTSKKISKESTLYVIDIEIVSKMRLNILDEKNQNILDTKYDYSKFFQNTNINQNIKTSIENQEYDTSLYNFSTPDLKWNYLNDEYMQSHLIRFEFEKKNKFQNIFKKPYNTLLITDIDLALKGNKHFKIKKN